MEQDVRFSRIARPAYQHPENISRHAGVALLVASCGRKVGIVIWNFHFLIYLHQIAMSVKRWRQQEKENAELEEQDQEICQEFKMNKIKKKLARFRGKSFSSQSQDGWIKLQKSQSRLKSLQAPTTKWTSSTDSTRLMMSSGQTLKYHHHHHRHHHHHHHHQHHHWQKKKKVMTKVVMRCKKLQHEKRGRRR